MWRTSLRARVAAACLISGGLCFFGYLWLRSLRTQISCSSELISGTPLCTSRTIHSALPSAAIVLSVVVLLACVFLLSRWAVRPITSLIAPISRLGPQNLAERVPIAGRDDLGILAATINAMMERIAGGYEGQRRFAANASHELRTPLAIQRALIEVSMAEPMSAGQVDLLTRQLLATNERNEELIEGLLVLSESDRGLASTTPQRLDVITAEIADQHRALAAKSNVSITTELTERTVLGERVLLERLITNLIQNAIKYNVDGGRVCIVVNQDLVVENTGNPIPAEAVAGLFEPFRRLSSDRLSHGGGAGLGLTIARSIVQAHQGTIAAQPGSEGGLRISVNLASQLT